MDRTKARSVKAQEASLLVDELQYHFMQQLSTIGSSAEDTQAFEVVEWLRDQGRHGGGVRYVATNKQIFNRGSINVSQIHYDDDSSKKLASATALSTIIHPENPFASSVHMHISWTEMKDGRGYWRIMADLNPAIENEMANTLFSEGLKKVAPKQYKLATEQGNQYFYIPTLSRRRGVSHFYLEEFSSDDTQADFDLAKNVGKTVIDLYLEIFQQALQDYPSPSEENYKKQQAYHTLYLFQVLTLDRGTTSGLLVHDQNDLGIMGSLPANVDKDLLFSWKEKLKSPQNQLLQNILDVLSDDLPCKIDDETKIALAKVVRQHYKSHPDALSMQAKGSVAPMTVDNHNYGDKG
jgi:coproporphyrinogen III oxidase